MQDPSDAWMTLDSMSHNPPPLDGSDIHRFVSCSSNDVTVGGGGSEAPPSQQRLLRFILLGCETRVPYGPLDHTAQLFADAIAAAAVAHNQKQQQCDGASGGADWSIAIRIYNAQAGEYPTTTQEWDDCDGVLLPGSFSAAYDDREQPWIAELQRVIRDEIVAKQRPTLGVCFGHQVLAHCFESGKAVITPSGPRAGRYPMETTLAGKDLFKKDSVDLYYTHGDMVDQLPDTAVCLGGSKHVPIEAAAYLQKPEDAARWRDGDTTPRPYAISFQAHPEYATSMDLGVYRTLNLCMDAMEKGGGISKERRDEAVVDASYQFPKVREDSIETMLTSARVLGWF